MGRRQPVTDRADARRRYDAKRRQTRPSVAWYKSPAWKIRKRDQRAKQPLCELCLADGLTRLMSIVDHHPPHRDDYAQFFTGPVRSLCKPHHDSVAQADEARGFSVQTGADGWPTDDQNPFNSGATMPKNRNAKR